MERHAVSSMLAVLLAAVALLVPVASLSASAPPSVPQDFLIEPQPSSLLLTWKPPASDGGSPLLGYNVYRGDIKGGAKSVLVQVAHSPDLRFDDTKVFEGSTYYYQLSAYNADGEGPMTGELSGTSLSSRDRPDLRVRKIDLVPPAPRSGDLLEIRVIVENRGGAHSPAALVRVQVDSQLLVERITSSLPPGTSVIIESSLVIGSGAHTISAFADPANLIPEPDEVDNYAIKNFLVPEPTPEPADAAVWASVAALGFTAAVVVIIAVMMMRRGKAKPLVWSRVGAPPARYKR